MSSSKDKDADVKGNDPSGPPSNVGSFISQRTKQRIYVFAKKGESSAAALSRVKKHHGMNG